MAKDYSYYFSQLRRIEDHREAKAEKEIRKIYKNILSETKQFIAEEYYNLAEDGKLTFEILRSKGQDARFLQEVESRLSDISLDVSREIKQTVEEMYQLAYDGVRDAVQKGSDTSAFFEGTDSSTIQTMRATVDNPIMEIALEKNHKDITWDIKREVARALMVGDRFDSMAHRIADTMNRSYKKAILISRTEVGRVREAGHLASAKSLNETLKKGSSGMQMVKKWKSMQDGRVRDQHISMNNKIVEMDELFELPDGTETQAPKQSGVARHDCNCRCTCLYPLMDDEEYFKATGKHFSENGVAKNPNEDKIEAGAVTGALNDVNDPDHIRRDEHADLYYAEIRNSSKESFVSAVSKNTSVNQEIVAKTYKHIFEDKHDLEKGYDYFDTDYDMAESFRRLRTNDNIQNHDVILLYHEALEYDIMQANPTMPYEEAHAIAEQTYNYKAALNDWLRKQGGRNA